MGLVCSSRLLNLVPALVDSIKVAGLVLVTNTSEDEGNGDRVPDGVDGVLKANGVLCFHETIDM